MSTDNLLDFIAAHESRNQFDAVWGRIAAKHRPPKPITQMTIGQVLAWQDSIDKHYMSEAAGAYQILEDTLRGLYAEAGLKTTDLFNEANQRKLGTALLVRRGLNRYRNGSISATTFANELAKEWASLPVVTGPKKGRSYYAGDGLNKALVSVEPFLAAVKAASANEPAKPVAAPSFVARLFAALAKLFGK